MPPRFIKLTLGEFADVLERFDFTRKIDSIHMHHTWRPNHSDYRGESTIDAMWRYHTQQNGWRDIAQHITIAPDGAIWTGRNWNLPPASAVGYNGNAFVGPFMFETIGDFDKGQDLLEGAQLDAVLGVIARVQNRCSLGPDALHFHRAMTNLKSCPGTSLDLEAIKKGVVTQRAALSGAAAKRAAPRAATARGAGAWAEPERLQIQYPVDEALRAWRLETTTGRDAVDAELEEAAMSDEQARVASGVSGATLRAPGAEARAARGPELTPEMLAELRPHVLNLNQGRFSGNGIFRTSPADVDAIFDNHLSRAVAAARANGRPLRLLFWAHGGLISESSGLWIAHQQVAWWKKNGTYPIHFVWETGFLDALRQILAGSRQPAPRGVPRDLWDHTTDLALETVAKALGGVKIWSAMKRSAEVAAASGGGSAYVAGKLLSFCKKHKGDVELHAVGHSAGSIFHSQFLRAAFEMGVPPFKTLQLLAPAIRVDEFKQRLLAYVGKQIQSLTMFTMQRDWEEDDNTGQVYRKSLLYLIYYALEPERKTPILGLEESVREDGDLRSLFGLGGGPPRADVVWSVTKTTSGASATTSRSHGGFDNNRPTMNSVAHRILGEPPAVPFPDEAIERGIALLQAPPGGPFTLGAFVPTIAGAAVPAADAPAAGFAPPAVFPAPSAGRRRAICVGIDHYPTMPLAGCVADAQDWAHALAGLGFETAMLLDSAATRGRILDELGALLKQSRAGDVVVFQFAGHGTELDDLDGDEVDGNNGPRDEAICPYDIAEGAFVIDDDLADVFGATPDGVNVTCFIDCCHSGTITRLMVGPSRGNGGRDVRARFLPATVALQAAHRRFRERLGLARGVQPGRTAADMRQVVFSACLDSEVAYENDGHGEFTLRATRLLASGVGGQTNEEFQRRVTAAFGEAARQHPDLDCAPAARTRALLAAPAGAPAGIVTFPDGQGRAAGDPAVVAIARTLRALADTLAPGR